MKLLSLCLCVSVVNAFAAIDGTVINQTTGKPQAGVVVKLMKLAQGMDEAGSTTTGADGKFSFAQDAAGASVLLQSTYEGVAYNQMLPPGSPTTGVQVKVYNASKQSGDAKVSLHMMLLEPAADKIAVSETYMFQNGGNTTWDDPSGTLKFYAPEGAADIQVHVTAPQGMPVQRSAEPAGQTGVYKVVFPIKPGDSRIDLSYTVPARENGAFAGKVLYKGGATTRLVTPAGVTLSGDNLTSQGAEPRTQANVYDVNGSEFAVKIAGTGSLRAPQQQEQQSDENSGSQIDVVMPNLFGQVQGDSGFFQKVLAVKWVLLITLAILTLGFILLYRQKTPQFASAGKEPNERRRR